MNNLKRILSLALASVMLVGMMVVGASAAEFTDADDITNKDAVDTLVALKVIDGMDPEHFVPNGDVTRAQMAKMIAFALNGGKAPNVGLPTNMTFTDVPATHWAAEYVEYCANLGIIDGRGNGIFDPEGKVTGQEAAKMMLVAIGYDVNDFSLKGANWAINVDLHASNLGLYDDVRGFSRNPLTRENAAQLIYNGIQAPTASRTELVYGSNGISYKYDLEGDPLLATCFGAEMTEGQLTKVVYNEKDKEYTYTIGGDDVKATVDVSDKIGQTVNLVYLDGDVVAITTKFNGVLSSGYIKDLNTKTEDKLDGYKTYKTQADVKVWKVEGGQTSEGPENATTYIGNKYDCYRLVDLDGDSVIDLMVVLPVYVAKVTEIDEAGNVANTADRAIAPATSTIPELEAGDYILATTNGKGGYTVTKANTVSGTVTSVRNESEVRINGTWYKSIANASLSKGNLGDAKTLVLVGGAYAFADDYDDGTGNEVSKDLAVIVALGDKNTLTGAQQANLVLADGSVLTAVNVKAGKDTELKVGMLFNYKADGNTYTLTTATKASTGFGSELVKTGNGYVAGANAKAATLGGKYINDDAVIIYSYKGTSISDKTLSTTKHGVLTGADLKALGGDFGDAGKCQYFFKAVDGLDYVQFALLVDVDATKLPDARDAAGTESYGFVVSDVAVEYNENDESFYAVYTVWNGTSNVDVMEELDNQNDTTAADKGVAIVFEDLGDGKVTNVTAVTNKVAITGFSKANGILNVRGRDTAYTLTDDTVYFNVNTAEGKEAGVAGTKLEIAPADKFNAWIVLGTNGKVKAIFVDTVNKEIK